MAKTSPDSRRFCNDEKGATMIEYALMLVLIAIVCMAGASQIGNINALFFDIGNTL